MSILFNSCAFSQKEISYLYLGLDAEMSLALHGENEQIYGELNFYAARALLKKLGITSKDSILDIGSGFGKFIIQALYETEARSIHGVEINEARYNIAAHAMSKIQEDKRSNRLYNHLSDITKLSIPEVTHIYTCSTVFPPKLLWAIGEMINSRKSVKKIASLRKIPNLKNHRIKDIIYLSCSWETVPCYIYSR